jgi:competence protein ComEC
VIVSMERAYGSRGDVVRHPLPELAVVGTAALVAVVCWPAEHRLTLGAALLGAVVAIVGAAGDIVRWRVVLVVLLVGGVAGCRAESAWRSTVPRQLGAYTGWVEVVGDPQPALGSTRVIVAIEGERFEYWARSRAKRIRVEQWRSGDLLLVSGTRRALEPTRHRRVVWQHVVGEVRLDWIAERRPGAPLDRASNRVRVTLERGSAVLPGADAALFRGLVVGDDADQPFDMIARFRASGLSHLTAVSGQNVAFVLAAAGPLLRRMRAGPRLVVTLALIGWFMALTRFEPSILRAGTMAAISAIAFVLGRERAPGRLLGLAVTALLLVDPLLVRSVGFWLSAGATAGVVTLGPPLAGRLGRLGPVATPLGVTLGAQAGVAIPALLVFGRVPLVSVPANLLAVPVAGGVMLYGLPAGLLAGCVPPLAPVVMFPCRLGVRWVDLVAALGARLEPDRGSALGGWVMLLGLVSLIAVCHRPPDPVDDG